MGLIITKVVGESLIRKKKKKVIMIGLDGVGKTTALTKLKLGKIHSIIPLLGMHFETVESRTLSFMAWDVKGRGKEHLLYQFYYQGVQAIIFMVDSGDRERIEDAKEELRRAINHDDLRDALLLVYANKQDLPGAMTSAEIVDRLELTAMGDRKWTIISTCATRGDGLLEGLQWVERELEGKQKIQPIL